MALTPIQTRLTAIHGPGIYLTPSQMNWLGGSRFTPENPEAQQTRETRLIIDKPRPDIAEHRGDTCISLGQRILEGPAIPETYDGALTEDMVFKYPGDDTHYLPKQLENLLPLFKAFADFQYQNSPYATGKIGLARISARRLTANKEQQGHGWHRHTLSISDTFTPEHISNFEINEDDIGIISQISRKLAATEGFWSNLRPTWVQTELAEEPIATTRSDSVHTHGSPIETPPFKFKKMEPNELGISTSETFHTSAVPDSSDDGKDRVFLYMGYYHTQETEAAYLANEGLG